MAWSSWLLTVIVVPMLTIASGLALKLEPRVIGGVEVTDRCRPPFNWIVALQITSPSGPVTFCSSVMLDNRTLITAGRCIDQFATTNTNPGVAVVGDLDRTASDSDEQEIPIESLRLHPNYSNTTYDNNIALIRLAYAARISRCVRPFAKMEDDPAACQDLDTSCIMAGWGTYVESSRPTNSRLLRSAPITVYGDFVTLQLELTRTQRSQPRGSLYAEAFNPRQKACFFDWGGVVACIRNGNTVLRGVVGEHNCNAQSAPPMMVTNVPDFQQWIEACQNNWNSRFCRGGARTRR